MLVGCAELVGRIPPAGTAVQPDTGRSTNMQPPFATAKAAELTESRPRELVPPIERRLMRTHLEPMTAMEQQPD